ncbi:MAG TPA: DUF1922 domain-containing protein [Methanospirillum sp.]|nr:DUF1922 domain-containing protein [Methanospirillum sp.]
MFQVIRCGGCGHIMTTPESRNHVLCPVCGVTSPIKDLRVYLKCRDNEVAGDVAHQLSQIISRRHGRDLSPEEIEMLRERFAAFEKQNDWI